MTAQLLANHDESDGPPRPITSPPIWKHLLWGVVIFTLIWFLSKIPSTLIVFSMAWLIAYLLNPLVDALCQRKIGPIKSCSRTQAVLIVASLLLGAMVAAGAMILPQLSEQVNRVIQLQQSLGDPQEFPELFRAKVEPWLAKVPAQYRDQAMAKATTVIQESASQIGTWASQIIKSVGAFLGQLLSAIFLVCSAFLVSLYMLLNWHNLASGMLEKLPRQYQKEVRSLSHKLNEIFGGYLKATILTSLACTVATFVSLFILCLVTGHDFPYKGVVAFVAGLSYPIPVIGIIATSILGGVLGFVSESNLGFGMMVLVTINAINILIDRTVQPRLMSGAIGVSELFVMFAAFAGGEVAGVWGMLLGIPVAAMGKTLFEWFHVNFLLVDELPPEDPTVVVAGTAPAPPVTSPPPALPSPTIETLDRPRETTDSSEHPVAVLEVEARATAPTFPAEIHAQRLGETSGTAPSGALVSQEGESVTTSPVETGQPAKSLEREQPTKPLGPRPSSKKRRKKTP